MKRTAALCKTKVTTTAAAMRESCRERKRVRSCVRRCTLVCVCCARALSPEWDAVSCVFRAAFCPFCAVSYYY